MTEKASVYAMFVDLMGFAEAIESLDEHGHQLLDHALTGRTALLPVKLPATELAHRYSRFHHHLQNFGDGPTWVDIAKVTFSDSAFIVMSNLSFLEHAAIALMRSFYKDEIPVRIGIGFGSYSRMTFSVSSQPAGPLTAVAPFLGSSIVRAYRAQASKTCKGFRIIVHPSVYKSEASDFAIPLSQDEASATCSHEVNLLLGPQGTHKFYSGREYLKRLKVMRRGVTNERALLHYDRSEIAIRSIDALNKQRRSRK